MTHLEIIKKAYDACGMIYVVKIDEDYQYLILTGKAGYSAVIENVSVEQATAMEPFLEFQNGMIASY